jgi:hypothetical protein
MQQQLPDFGQPQGDLSALLLWQGGILGYAHTDKRVRGF